ncbi:MAG: thiaminase II/PqqC family protein [Cuniculiplasma sp.]
MVSCPVCYESHSQGDFYSLSTHFLKMAKKSDYSHVSWLNRNIVKYRVSEEDLEKRLERFYSLDGKGLKRWIIDDFVKIFRGDNPHPFILAMQKYDVNLLKGYVIEHHHFLKQWIKSCAYVIAKSDYDEIHDYELENIITEMQGVGKNEPSHHELLIQMGISLGLTRDEILNAKPLPATKKAVDLWNRIGRDRTWIETMVAMHSLELIANRDLGRYGAKYPYFDPEILKSDKVTSQVKAFLKEGYEADVSHSYVALDLIEKYGKEEEMEDIQSAYLVSSRAFSDYLDARMERGEMYKNKQ